MRPPDRRRRRIRRRPSARRRNRASRTTAATTLRSTGPSALVHGLSTGQVREAPRRRDLRAQAGRQGFRQDPYHLEGDTDFRDGVPGGWGVHGGDDIGNFGDTHGFHTEDLIGYTQDPLAEDFIGYTGDPQDLAGGGLQVSYHSDFASPGYTDDPQGFMGGGASVVGHRGCHGEGFDSVSPGLAEGFIGYNPQGFTGGGMEAGYHFATPGPAEDCTNDPLAGGGISEDGYRALPLQGLAEDFTGYTNEARGFAGGGPSRAGYRGTEGFDLGPEGLEDYIGYTGYSQDVTGGAEAAHPHGHPITHGHANQGFASGGCPGAGRVTPGFYVYTPPRGDYCIIVPETSYQVFTGYDATCRCAMDGGVRVISLEAELGPPGLAGDRDRGQERDGEGRSRR